MGNVIPGARRLGQRAARAMAMKLRTDAHDVNFEGVLGVPFQRQKPHRFAILHGAEHWQAFDAAHEPASYGYLTPVTAQP